MRTAPKTTLRSLFACALFLSGCTIYRAYPPNANFSAGPEEEIIGPVREESSAYYVLVFGPFDFGEDGYTKGFNNDSLLTALKKAKIRMNADAVVNVIAERSVYYFPAHFLPLYRKTTTTITGTAIRYRNKVGSALPARSPAP